MRSDKELGEILLNNKHLFGTGLCKWSHLLFIDGLITAEECEYLHEKIKDNRPEYKFIKHALYNPDKVQKYGNGFYWKVRRIEPRIKWIKKHLIEE